MRFANGRQVLLGSIGAVDEVNQVRTCAIAQQSRASGSLAAPVFERACGEKRAINIAAGRLFVDALPPDAAMRVVLTDTGRRIIAGTPELASFARTLPPDVERGFAIGVKVRAGGGNPTYAAYVRRGLSADNARGFDLGLSGAGAAGGGDLVRGPASSSSSDDEIAGLPRAVVIGGAAIGVLAIGAAIYKFTR